MTRLTEIMDRRMALVAAAAAQREQVRFYSERLASPVRAADSAFRIARTLRSPLLLAALGLLFRRRRQTSTTRAPRRRSLLAIVPGGLLQGWRLIRFLYRLRK